MCHKSNIAMENSNKNYKRVNLVSEDLRRQKLAQLKQILPEAFSEGKINCEKLKTALGESVDFGSEKFGFAWAGKIEAVKNVLVSGKTTLKPAKNESVKFDESENIFIEGDNLEVLKLLQKAYFEKIKMIYIDPPYNTGGDFVYKDNFTAPLKGYLEQTGQVDGNGNKLQANRETNGRYHSDWLSMMYPRLKLAWNLLRDDGVIFISIDDNEVHHLRMIMDEIFGEENFIVIFPWRKRSAKSDVPFGISQDFEWIICYTKKSFIAGIAQERKYYKTDDFPNDRWRLSDLTTQKIEADRPNSAFDLVDPKTNKVYSYNPKRLWGVTKETFQDYYDRGKIVFPDDYDFMNISIPAYRVFESEDRAKALKKYGVEESIKSISTLLPKDIGMNQDANKEVAELFGGMSPFSFPKPTNLIRYLIKIVNNFDEDMVVLDFFAGSGTTAQAVMMQNVEDGGNRKWICVQLPEAVDIKSEAYKAGYKTIADIAKERIRRVINGYGENPRPIDDGFKVFKLAESNYPENNFEFDPEKPEEENKKAFLEYLAKARQVNLFGKTQELDVVYENIVKEGLSLNAKIEEREIAGVKIYKVLDGEKQLLICLESKILPDAVKEFRKLEYKSRIFICLDNALDDTAKANLALNVELKTI